MSSPNADRKTVGGNEEESRIVSSEKLKSSEKVFRDRSSAERRLKFPPTAADTPTVVSSASLAARMFTAAERNIFRDARVREVIMALTGIINLAERLLNQSQSQAQTEQKTPQIAPTVPPNI